MTGLLPMPLHFEIETNLDYRQQNALAGNCNGRPVCPAFPE
jgi:hypothetical protein